MAKKENDTIVTFVLDESGSMDPVREKTISGFNEYIQTLKSDDTPTFLRLMSFNSMGFKTVYDFENAQSVREISEDDYKPDSLTPLFDAIGQGIRDTDDHIRDSKEDLDVIFTIMTDGLENDSRKFTRRQIFEMISERHKQGWVFTFLGANQDSWEEGRRMGVKRGFTSDYSANSPDEALRRTAYSTLGAKAAMKMGIRPEEFFEQEQRVRRQRRARPQK